MKNKPCVEFRFWLRKSSRFIFSRFFLVSLLLFLQALIFFLLLNRFFTYSLPFYTVGTIISVLTVIYLISATDNLAYKLMWAIFILTISPIGSLIYWLIGWQKIPVKKLKEISSLIKKSEKYLFKNDQKNLLILTEENQLAAYQASYLQNWAHAPLFQNTKTQYFCFGEDFFRQLKIELKQAQRFIFLEYFIIEENSQIWTEILTILQERISHGVEVRLIYDDLASVLSLSGNFAPKMDKLGIKTIAFNRFRPFLEVKINHRDHRKIAIIDNQVAFTGGINLGDRYINLIQPYGVWKDTAVMLQGEAVWSFTLMFLELWNFISGEKLEVTQYQLPTIISEKDGFVQPFADIPYDHEAVSHNVYLNLIHKAQEKIIITTPYLIIDQELNTALCLAAKSGVQVKIITPKHFDHWYTKIISQAFYIPLLEENVEIWQYEPGFIHSKSFLVDDQIGVISTINLDYRSFYLNFEDGVWMYQTQATKELSQDLETTLAVCRQVKINEIKKVRLPIKLLRGVLRLLATLM